MNPKKRDSSAPNAKFERRRSCTAASMAAFRRVAALAFKMNLRSPAKGEFLGGEKARRRAAAGMLVAAGGVAALYFYNGMTSGRERRRQSINAFLQSIPAVEAKEKVGNEIIMCFIIIVFPVTIALEYNF